MRYSALAFGIAAALLLIQSCGYIGPVAPPSLHIPNAIADLAAVEIGNSIEFQFTLPQQTTDYSTITKFKSVDLRVGPELAPFDIGTWSTAATAVPITPEQADTAVNDSQPLKASLAVSGWAGKDVAIAVRTAQRDNHFSQWSNVIHMRVVGPLDPPIIQPEASAEGVKVTISSAPEHAKVRIFRQGPADQQPQELGVAQSPEFIDRGADYGTKYTYTAIAFDDSDKANARSQVSETATITPMDTFAPSVPVGVTVLTGTDSIEVSWEPSPERDTKGYHLFRSSEGGAFERVGGLITLPTYSDKDVQRGKKYRYQVSAIDERNNESPRSAALDASF
jgi:hypothetical protein